MELKNIVGMITLDGSLLQNAVQEDLEALAMLQTDLGKILARVLASNKMSPKVNIYTMRDNDYSFNITVSYCKE